MFDFKGKKSLVIGLNTNAFEAIKVLNSLRCKITAFGKSSSFGWKKKTASEPLSFKFEVIQGENPPQNLSEYQVAILFGSSEEYSDLLAGLKAQNTPVFTPLLFILQLSTVPVIAITGTNGKSSVAKLTEQMLTASGKSVFLGGGSFEPYPRLISLKKKFD